jgi:hypothetical protein
VNLLPILSHPQDAVGLSPRLNHRWELQPQLKLSAGFHCPEKLQVRVGFEVEKQGHLKPESSLASSAGSTYAVTAWDFAIGGREVARWGNQTERETAKTGGREVARWGNQTERETAETGGVRGSRLDPAQGEPKEQSAAMRAENERMRR